MKSFLQEYSYSLNLEQVDLEQYIFIQETQNQ